MSSAMAHISHFNVSVHSKIYSIIQFFNPIFESFSRYYTHLTIFDTENLLLNSQHTNIQTSPATPPTTPKPRLLPRLSPTHENIYTVPNILTFSRLLSAPAIGYLILTHQHTLALSLFAYAGFTDLVDGYIARRYGQQTVVGTVIDPMADKTLMTVGVICLAIRGDMPSSFILNSTPSKPPPNTLPNPNR
jgi:CDP-alcohol phosphatidyltransferase